MLFPLSRHVLPGPTLELVRINYTDSYDVENDAYSVSGLALLRFYVPDGSPITPWGELGGGLVVSQALGSSSTRVPGCGSHRRRRSFSVQR